MSAAVAVANFFLWFWSPAGRVTWRIAGIALLLLAPGWVLTHGIALSRRGPAATIANTMAGQLQEAAVKKAAQDAVDRMKTLSVTPPARP